MPTGLARWSSFWDHALLGSYGFDSGEHPKISYMLAALIGMAVIALGVYAVFLVVRFINRIRKNDDPARAASASP